MKFFTTFLVLLYIIGCSKASTSEKIVLTSGLNTNPSEPRFGIELNNNHVFYCVENLENKGYYFYYEGIIKSDDFKKIKNKIKVFYESKINTKNVKDGDRYELLYCHKNTVKSIIFETKFLNAEQLSLLEEIISFKYTDTKNIDFKSIDFHEFPKTLLQEKLPEPPAVPPLARAQCH